MWILFGVSFIFFFVCFCLVWFSFKCWIVFLKDLREIMLEIVFGNQNFCVKEVGVYELREVICQFNVMLDQVDQLMVDICRQEEMICQY